MQVPGVRGAELVVAWWGRWIGFHDFYLLEVPRPGDREGELRIHGWVTHQETDERGCFKTSKDCIVRICLTDIRRVDLSSAELPAILFGLQIEAVMNGWRISWDSSYGCGGMLDAADAIILLEPGRPSRVADKT